MYRTTGVVALATGAVVAGWLAIAPFERAIPRWFQDESGNITQATTSCPSPVATVFGDAAQQVQGATLREGCILASRTKLVEAGLVAGLALLVGVIGLSRGPKPPRRPIEEQLRPLPSNLDHVQVEGRDAPSPSSGSRE